MYENDTILFQWRITYATRLSCLTLAFREIQSDSFIFIYFLNKLKIMKLFCEWSYCNHWNNHYHLYLA
jgi:hypothetical protein